MNKRIKRVNFLAFEELAAGMPQKFYRFVEITGSDADFVDELLIQFLQMRSDYRN